MTRNNKAIRLAATLTAALSLGVLASACVTSDPESQSAMSIRKADNSLLLAGASIGQQYDAVMQRAKMQFESEPHCEQRKIAIGVRRKAHPYAVCAFMPKGVTIAEAPLNEVVYHFVDLQLVRVDTRSEGASELIEKLKADASLAFGASAEQLTQSDASAAARYHWQGSSTVLGLRQGTSANANNVYMRLNDAELSAQIPWLSED